MSSTYNGSGSTVHTSADLLDDGDRPRAALWRVPYEKILDSLAAIATALGGATPALALTVAGGTRTLLNNLTVNGTEWRFGAIARVLSGATFLIDAGGAAIFNALATFNANVRFELEAHVRNAASLFVDSGATLAVSNGGLLSVAASGEARMADADRLTINAAAFTARMCMTPIAVPSGWSWGVSGGTVGWDMATASGETIYFALPFRPGDTLTSVTMRLEGDAAGGGGHSGLPADMPQIQVVRKDESGAFTIVGTQVDSSADETAYDAAHDVTLTLGGGGHSFVANNVYYVRITAEGGANADAGSTRVYSLKFTGLARSYRGSVEVYQ